jgi:ABC transporter, permease protein
MKKKEGKMILSKGEVAFLILTKILMLIFAVMCLYPFLYVLAVSLSSPGPVMRGEVYLIPKGFSLEVYRKIFSEGTLVNATIRSIIITIVYVIVAMTITILCAYPLSVPELKGKKILNRVIIFTMYFSGGTIPSYLVVRSLGLIDNYLALVLPCCLSVYNMIVLRSFFVSIPVSLREAAIIDGAGDGTILMKVVLPMSKPAIATVSLYYCVSRWNAFMDSLLYFNDPTKAVLQLRLKQLVMNADSISSMMEGGTAGNTMIAQTVRSGALMFSMVPIMLVYPFLQKYFVKGTMIGSVKG